MNKRARDAWSVLMETSLAFARSYNAGGPTQESVLLAAKLRHVAILYSMAVPKIPSRRAQ